MVNSSIRDNRATRNDSQLALMAKEGDLGAFNELVLLHQDAIYNLAYRILGDADSAEDITQDAFLSAYRNLPRFRNGSFRSWLFRIAMNACFDELRRHKRHPMLPIESEDGSEEDLIPAYDMSIPQFSPEREYEQHELRQAIQRALNLLDPGQRAAVVLVDIQDLNYQDAAEVLQVPIGTVKSRLARARMQLRQFFIHNEI
jgi:RNA polymerase sigma factor (sigma-70 family)